MVGAVIVAADGTVLGEGFHAKAGDLHAETAALEDARARNADVRGATMYVTLEPCAHEGRQPPCSDAILASAIGRVVIASDDPTEKASGRGPGMLRDGGVEVAWAEGAEAAAARLLNQPFRKRARTGRPWVMLKAALTLDGRTATATGDSKWISGDDARELVHHWRAHLDAVAIGIETAIADDALLTSRGVGAAKQPTRVIFDSRARLPLDGALVRTATEAPVIVIAGPEAAPKQIDALTNAGVEVVVCGGDGPTASAPRSRSSAAATWAASCSRAARPSRGHSARPVSSTSSGSSSRRCCSAAATPGRCSPAPVPTASPTPSGRSPSTGSWSEATCSPGSECGSGERCSRA